MPEEASLSGQTAVNNPAILPTPAEGKEHGRRESPFSIGGHQEIAALMAHTPATAIFKRFGFLHALNILYFQAELAMLEDV